MPLAFLDHVNIQTANLEGMSRCNELHALALQTSVPETA